MPAERIRIRGQVQGVGFRPFVWRLAAEHGVTGDVRNDAEGVLIRAQGPDLDAFAAAIEAERPPLARIDAVERAALDAPLAATGFSIVETGGGAARTRVTPDAATCPACLAEISDPAERRADYAFANCTHCGPRFSILERIPYDRAATTMRAFEMCPDCRAEYDDPADRRFHAQPIACPVCGPRLSFLRSDRRASESPALGDPIALAADALRTGEIVAVKGLGGYQLACDARNETAVSTLRARKRRPDKPFALMGRDLDMIARWAELGPAERALLSDPAGPILLLQRRTPEAEDASPLASPLAPSLAPGLDQLGWMLPTTPLHHLLLAAVDRPLVMTSGNLSGEPQAIDDAEALTKLSGFADAFLAHDRPIARRLDDSVARVQMGELRLLRRARGYAPATLELPIGLRDAPPILAVGAELKAALCLTRDGAALLTHHLGDLEDALTYAEYERAAEDYAALFDHAPAAVVCDLHPGYRSTAFAERRAEALDAPLIRVQHHHAHAAAAMAENGWPADGAPVLAIALDGTGYGPDQTVWGGEVLLCDYRDYERLARLAPVALPGAAAAVREPWRCLAAQLDRCPDPEPLFAAFAPVFVDRPVETLRRMIAKGVNAPLSSSAGRLFDAVAAALGIAVGRQSYEGQTGMALEALARRSDAQPPYPFAITEAGPPQEIDPAPLWTALAADLAAGLAPERIARRFHEGLASAFADRAARALAARPEIGAVALSGGVLQNALLFELLSDRLTPLGRPLLAHRETPANDGGLALGQAAIAAARLRR